MKLGLVFALFGSIVGVAACASPAATDEADDSSSSALASTSFVARGTGYYPSNSGVEGGFTDRKGARLRTLQQYLAGQADYVSVAMDVNAFPYGQRLRIHELNTKYGKDIVFKVVDTGGAFRGKGRSRIDICTASSKASLDPTINGSLHIDVVSANAPPPAPTTPPAPPATGDDDDDSTSTGSSSGGASSGGGSSSGGASSGGASSGGSSSGGAACVNDGMCNPGNDGSGLICVAGQCTPGCHTDAQCPGSTTCNDGQCE